MVPGGLHRLNVLQKPSVKDATGRLFPALEDHAAHKAQALHHAIWSRYIRPGSQNRIILRLAHHFAQAKIRPNILIFRTPTAST